jgi:hypothetical protein
LIKKQKNNNKKQKNKKKKEKKKEEEERERCCRTLAFEIMSIGTPCLPGIGSAPVPPSSVRV